VRQHAGGRSVGLVREPALARWDAVQVSPTAQNVVALLLALYVFAVLWLAFKHDE
jgi:hypothetical protein